MSEQGQNGQDQVMALRPHPPRYRMTRRNSLCRSARPAAIVYKDEQVMYVDAMLK